MKRDQIQHRVLEIGRYIANTHSTVRQASQQFSVSKSIVHRDMVDKLGELDKPLHQRVLAVLAYNKTQRHIRGGRTTQSRHSKKSS